MPFASLTADELVGVLDALDVHFLSGGVDSSRTRPVQPRELFAELATQEDARLQLAIIPLLLRHPEFAESAHEATAHLPDRPRHTLQLFYTAAVFLQRQHYTILTRLVDSPQPLLPNDYADEYGLPSEDDPSLSLRLLGQKHAELSGLAINWTGAYQHAANRFISRLEHEALWVQQKVA